MIEAGEGNRNIKVLGIVWEEAVGRVSPVPRRAPTI